MDFDSIDDQLLNQPGDPIWELFHENSKMSLRERHSIFALPPSDETIVQKMNQLRIVKPYRDFPKIALPEDLPAATKSFDEVLVGRTTARQFVPGEVYMEELAKVLYMAYGITRDNANNQFPRSFRTIPSGGALYPLEIYIHATHVEGLASGLYHYDPVDDPPTLDVLRVGDESDKIATFLFQDDLARSAAAIVFVSAVFLRSTFKYGDRGYRFTLLEAGHLGQNAMLAAEEMGLAAAPIGGYLDREVDQYLGFDGLSESVVYILLLGRQGQKVIWKSGTSEAPLPPIMQQQSLSEKLVEMVGQISALFLEGYKTLGPIFRFNRLNQEFTVIAGPEANLFLAREGKNYIRADEFRREQNNEFGIEKTLVSMNGEEHQHLRKIQKRGYSRSVLDRRYPELVTVTQNIARRWQPGQLILVRDVMPRLIAERLGVGVLNYPLGDYFEDVVLFVRTVVIETVAKTRPRKILDSPEYQRAKARAMELADKVIEAHRTQMKNDREPDLVDDLLAALAEDEKLMSEQELRVAVLGGYIGGLDTVAYTCSFMLYALLKNLDVLARVLAEVNAVFADGLPTPTTLKGMQALHHAALETLRLYPVSPAIQATVACPFEFAGYRVDQGQNLIVGATVPHLLSEFYPDPFKFDIDRYGAPRNEHQQPGVFAPFGLGPHICLGAGMAEVLIMLTVATVLHTVHLEMDPPDYKLKIRTIPTPVPYDFHIRVVEQRLQGS